MDYSGNILDKIDVASKNFSAEVLQELLVLMKRSKSNNDKEFWNKVAESLWIHLMRGLDKLDDQLLCATCFYSIIIVTDKQDYYLDKLLHIVGPHPSSPSQCIRKPKSLSKELSLETDLYAGVKNKDHSDFILQIMSLMYGMFQSSFLSQKTYYNIPIIAEVVKEIVDLLLLMGYEYSQYTFLVFKTIKSFSKVCGGYLEEYIFNKLNQVRLLDLVNNNWENPIAGVRDLNRSIFQTLLSTLDEETFKKILKDIDALYWNKAKYLMLTEIVESSKENLASFVKIKVLDGLIYSLNKPGLVSAGADMYYAILKKINKQDYWCELYLCHVINVLIGNSVKAIENFNNYWCLITFKKFKGLVSVLLDELEKQDDSEVVLYSKLCIMKQGNKLGIIDKNFLKVADTSIQKAVFTGIKHYNNNVRICAFDIICVSQRKLIPSAVEYDLILEYLFHNINSDSTVLRLSMFSCFNMFLSQLHSTFINVIVKNENNGDMHNLLNFCEKLQSFIVHNLNIKGNYQRKITSVKLCNNILMNFSEISRKKKDQTRHTNLTLKDFLKGKTLWLLSSEEFIMKLILLLSDPAEDVRENIINTLLNHYLEELENVTLLTLIVDNAKKSLRSKFFYEISCSQSMYKLIANLLIKQSNAIQFEYKTVEDVFDFPFMELMNQHKRPINIMDSIERGKQLHSYINILLVVLNECVANNCKMNIHSHMSELLEALENISNQFAWEEGCSDFSKMNDMVQNIIDDSHYKVDEDEYTKISGMQQIVLNCMWLNVKASCDLASILVQYNSSNVSMCDQCLNIITRVLETSRHKGAIEAAGAALGRAIQYLTSLTKSTQNDVENKSSEENVDVSLLPHVLLKRKLNDLISETNKMSSTTRRGAGLSIMVHRIVSSDMQKNKPLFHYFIKTLLQMCDKMNHLSENHHTETDEVMENRVDLPKAIYIHFLTRIVTDSSLSTDMMYYSVELAELAFGNLTSPHWQIRNAALQLYGALVPRLIGQKKASGTDEETIATIACDELRTHFPKLWVYITEQLEQNCDKDIQAHSNLVPILNVLANSAKRYPILLDLKNYEWEFEKLFYNLISLLKSPIHTVRRLTARTIFNLYQFDYITNAILKQKNISENLLHGFLLLLNLCCNYYTDSKHQSAFLKLKIKFSDIFHNKRCSYINKKIYEDIFGTEIDCIENMLLELRNNVCPGVHDWAEARLKKYIHESSWNDIPRIMTVLLQEFDYEIYCEFVFFKIKTQNNVPTDILAELADILIKFKNRFDTCIIWKIVYEISLKANLCIKTDDLLNTLKEKCSYKLFYMLPLISKNIAYLSDENKATLLDIIDNFSDFESSDFDKRYIAAIANNELAHEFHKLNDYLKVVSIKSAVLLLQDEDEDIRNLIVKYCSILFKEKPLLQPSICLNKILNRNLLYTVFVEPECSLQDLCTQLTDVVTKILQSSQNKDHYNPFSNDSKNIYFEPDVLKLFINNLM